MENLTLRARGDPTIKASPVDQVIRRRRTMDSQFFNNDDWPLRNRPMARALIRAERRFCQMVDARRRWFGVHLFVKFPEFRHRFHLLQSSSHRYKVPLMGLLFRTQSHRNLSAPLSS